MVLWKIFHKMHENGRFTEVNKQIFLNLSPFTKQKFRKSTIMLMTGEQEMATIKKWNLILKQEKTQTRDSTAAACMYWWAWTQMYVHTVQMCMQLLNDQFQHTTMQNP